MMNLEWLKYFISEPYWEGLYVVPILLVANLFLGVFYNLSIWYKLTEQTKFGALITIIGATITLLINFIFIPRYGYAASAVATLFAYGTMMVLSYQMGKALSYKIQFKERAFSFTALAMYFISLLYKDKLPNKVLEVVLNNFYF